MNFEKMATSHFQKIGTVRKTSLIKKNNKSVKAFHPNTCTKFCFDVVTKCALLQMCYIYFLKKKTNEHWLNNYFREQVKQSKYQVKV